MSKTADDGPIETPIPPYTCECGYTQDRATSAEGDERPTPGDLSICFGCGETLVFEDGLRLRMATDDEILSRSAGELQEIAKVKAAIAYVKRRTQHKWAS